MQEVKRIDTMNYVNVMPRVSQGVGQTMDVDRITAEAERRIKSGEVQEIERAACRGALLADRF
jgi:hypothetical protein